MARRRAIASLQRVLQLRKQEIDPFALQNERGTRPAQGHRRRRTGARDRGALSAPQPADARTRHHARARQSALD